MMMKPGQPFALPGLQLPPGAAELEMTWIGPGVFLMGSPDSEADRSESERLFQASLSQGFWLAKTPVTQAQWKAVMGANPSQFAADGDDRPVENVSWFDGDWFCLRLNERFHAELPPGYRFALPTQTQWEYACRAGTTTRYHSGNDSSDLDRVAWHAENSLGETQRVGRKEPNNFGLFDMLGNVWEWCHDSPAAYPSGPATDWSGPENPKLRMIRGGSYVTPPTGTDFRCACNSYCDPKLKRSWFGFRVALRPATPVA